MAGPYEYAKTKNKRYCYRTDNNGSSTRSPNQPPLSSSSSSQTTQRFTTPQEPHPGNPETIATHLENVVTSMTEAINTRTLQLHPSATFFHPNLVSEPEYLPPSTGITAHFNGILQLLASYPQMRVQLLGVKAHVNWRAGYADVYAKQAVTGYPPGVVRSSVSVVEFRRGEDGRWLAVKVTGIRGMNGGGEHGEE